MAASKIVTTLEGPTSLTALKRLPEPEVMGNRHRPVPHWAVVSALEAELKERGFEGYKPSLILSQEGARLDATYDLEPERKETAKAKMVALRSKFAHYVPKELRESAGATLVLTHANNQSAALRIRTAVRIYICTNLAMANEEIGASVGRKHTGDESWEDRIGKQLDQALAGYEQFGAQIRVMRDAKLTDEKAKALLYDMFALSWGPAAHNKVFDAGEIYFAHETPDVKEQNRWALHNAVTRVMRETPLRRQVETSGDVLRILTADLMPAANPN